MESVTNVTKWVNQLITNRLSVTGCNIVSLFVTAGKSIFVRYCIFLRKSLDKGVFIS